MSVEFLPGLRTTFACRYAVGHAARCTTMLAQWVVNILRAILCRSLGETLRIYACQEVC